VCSTQVFYQNESRHRQCPCPQSPQCCRGSHPNVLHRCCLRHPSCRHHQPWGPCQPGRRSPQRLREIFNRVLYQVYNLLKHSGLCPFLRCRVCNPNFSVWHAASNRYMFPNGWTDWSRIHEGHLLCDFCYSCDHLCRCLGARTLPLSSPICGDITVQHDILQLRTAIKSFSRCWQTPKRSYNHGIIMTAASIAAHQKSFKPKPNFKT
jgi:hypothetical protein